MIRDSIEDSVRVHVRSLCYTYQFRYFLLSES